MFVKPEPEAPMTVGLQFGHGIKVVVVVVGVG